jgi:hypothetical protein
VTSVNRIALWLLKGVSVLGMGGSAVMLGFATFARPNMFAQAVRGGRIADGFEVVFDAMEPPLSVLFLAGLLYVAADIALRMPQRPRRHEESD